MSRADMDRLLTPHFVSAWLVSLVSGLAFFLFVHFPRFLEEVGASKVEIGLVVAATALSALAVRPLLGRELDRRGRRPVLLLGGFINMSVLGLYLTVNSLGPWLYTIRIIHGFGVALAFTAIHTVAADLVPEKKRTQGLALFGVSGLLPIALGGVLGEFVLDRWDFDGLFLTSLALSVVGFLLSTRIPESCVPAGRFGQVSFMRPLKQKNLRPLWWLTLVFALSLTAYFTFLRTFVDQTGIGTVAGFFAAYAGTAMTLRLVGGWLPDKVGPKRVLYPAMLVFATGFVVLGTATGGGAILVAGSLCGAGHAYAFPILYSLAFTRAVSTDRGSASAIFTGLFDMGGLIGGPTFGLIVTWSGYSAMFFAAAGWVVAGSIAFGLWEGDFGPRKRMRTTSVSVG